MTPPPITMQYVSKPEKGSLNPTVMYTAPIADSSGLGPQINAIEVKQGAPHHCDAFIMLKPSPDKKTKNAEELIKHLRYEGVLYDTTIIPENALSGTVIRLKDVNPHTVLATLAAALGFLNEMNRKITEDIVRREIKRTGLDAEKMGLIAFKPHPKSTFSLSYPSAIAYVKILQKGDALGHPLIEVGFLSSPPPEAAGLKEKLNRQFPHTTHIHSATGSSMTCPASLYDVLTTARDAGEMPDFLIEAIINHAHHVVSHHEHAQQKKLNEMAARAAEGWAAGR